MAEKQKEVNIIDQVKEIERKKKEALLIKSIQKLKVVAKEAIKAKRKMKAYLDELGLSEGDQKKLIDYINSQDEVQLTRKEKDDIKEEVKRDLSGERKKVEEVVITGYTTTTSKPFPDQTYDLLYRGNTMVKGNLGINPNSVYCSATTNANTGAFDNVAMGKQYIERVQGELKSLNLKY